MNGQRVKQLQAWTGRRVLVTGADGFIGSHLVELLVSEDASVTALTLYNSFNDWGWLEAVEARDSVKIVAGDVRDGHFAHSHSLLLRRPRQLRRHQRQGNSARSARTPSP